MSYQEQLSELLYSQIDHLAENLNNEIETIENTPDYLQSQPLPLQLETLWVAFCININALIYFSNMLVAKKLLSQDAAVTIIEYAAAVKEKLVSRIMQTNVSLTRY